jgi:ATP-dependent exoDNAse (exonuclease V) beta subunit
MTEGAMQNRVDTIIASAGTGKTYCLVEDIVAEVISGTEPHRILATTFTKKAAAELAGRIRATLIQRGRPDLGAAMLGARIGTVNAVCGTLLGEFAFETGRSPITDVIAEDRQTIVFGRATGHVFAEYGPVISEMAERFGIPARGYSLHGRAVRGWHNDVQRAVDLARSNGIPAERLALCAASSSASLLALFPNPAEDTAGALDAALRGALESCIVAIESTRATLKAGTLKSDVPVVEKALRTLAAGDPIAWPDWAKLAKLGATKSDEALFAGVVASASAHPRHPRLHADIERYCEAILGCAARCMSAYAAYKAERGLLDFVDQEMLALAILTEPSNRERLRELIGAVFVDEFQDSSPIQIAIFTALSQIAPRNLWVGDPKQSIYGFRDADPALTTAAAAAITAASGGATDYLQRSYRTRPQLAAFVNAAITPNMLRAGMTEEEVRFDSCARNEPDQMPAALSIWPTAGKTKAARTAALAARIAGLNAEVDPGAWAASDKDGTLRPVRGGDIAVLCRGNAQVSELATALSAHGLRVAVDRPGLLDQPEIEFTLAAFRWIADPSDGLALAEMARLSSDDDTWFEVVFEDDHGAGLVACLPFSGALDAIRAEASQRTPAEILDAILHAETMLATMLRWGNAEQRLQNLEALRALVTLYQEEQRAERQAATLAGASEWIAARSDARQPPSRHPDAINVLTYHGAKGLEWPVVILTELDAAAKAWPFGLTTVDEAAPDWADPLAARGLRFWPWPYGEQRKGVGLDVAAPASPEGIAVLDEERLERARLLYVGLTRARDHLVLTNPGNAMLWLDELADGSGAPLISFHPEKISAGGVDFAVRPPPDALEISAEAAAPAQEYTRPTAVAAVHLPLSLRPSDAIADTGTVRIAATEVLGPRFALVGDPDLQRLGEAIHRFLAGEEQARGPAQRISRAADMLARWGVPEFQPEDLVEIADRLHGLLDEQYGAAARLAEWPVHALEGLQVLGGRPDLLVDLGDGYAIIDHKSFPGSVEIEAERLRAVAGQLALYARALRQVTGKSRFEYWIHQPIAAVMTRIEVTWGE